MSNLEQIIDYGDYLATAKDANGNFWLVVKGNKDPNAVDPSGRPVLYPLLLFEYRGIINEGPPTYGNFVGDIRFNGQDSTQYAGIFAYSRNGYALTFDCDANPFGCSFTANNNQDRLNVIYPSLTGQTYTGADGKTYNEIDSTNPFTLYDGSFRMLMNNRRLGARVTASNLTTLGVLHSLTTGKKSVSFDRSSQQFLQLGYPSFKLTFTKTGCSAVAVVCFTGSAGNNERIFEAATGNNGQDSFCVYRDGSTNKLACTIYNGSTQLALINNVGSIVQGAWTTIVAVYENTTSTLKLYQDGALLSSVVCSAASTDKTMSWNYSYLGKSTFAADSYSNYLVAALFFCNTILSSTDVSYINTSNYEGLIYKGGSQLSDSTVSSYTPLFYTGSLVDKNVGESIFSWNGTAYQVTAANQPTVAQTTYMSSDSTGVTVNGNLSATNLAGTLTTAAQPNITSVGTLTSLTVSGSVTCANVNASNIYQIGGTRFLAAPNSGSVALGINAGLTSQATNSVAVGYAAGNQSQGTNSVAVGLNAGYNTQGSIAVAVGSSAGYNNQGSYTVAIGAACASQSQGSNAVAVGYAAGNQSQGTNCVAIGKDAGYNTQGTGSIAIGTSAGVTNQHANSIIISAQTTPLNSDGSSRFYVKPIRNLIDPSLPRLSYNATTGEIAYGDSTTAALLPITTDKTNNRVGINNTTPTTALDVNGTVTCSQVTLSGGPTIRSGTGSPESVVTAPVGSIYLRSDGGAGTCLYVKESGTGNIGWVAK